MAQLKLPNGALGLVVSAVNEAEQEDLFFPCDPRLFAVNVAGDPECGSLVFDLNKANEPDSARGAYLQSAFRVVKLPMGQPNALAFQLDFTGKKDTQGGFFCETMSAPAMDMPPLPGAGPGKTVVAGENPPDKGGFGFGEGSHNFGGPFHVGVTGDKHFHGVDADGNPINCLHLWTSSNFFMNRLADGPIRFELEYKKGQEKKYVVPCHLAWTGVDWAIWTTTDWYIPFEDVPTTRKPKIPEIPQLPYTLVDFPGQPPGQQPLRPNVATPALITQPGVNDQPFVPVPDDEEFNRIQQGGGWIASTDGRAGNVTPMAMVATLSATVAPAMMARPENYTSSVPSTGLFDYAGGAGNPDPDSDTAEGQASKADSSNPITAVGSAFGAQGGPVASGGSGGDENYGGEGDPWLYTQTPRGQITSGKKMSKYPGGTSSGGIVYHPPETDLRDLVNYGMVPPNTTLSSVYIVVAPGASFGAGIPDLAIGSIKTGYSWATDSATGDLVFYSHSFTVKSEALRLANTGQTIEWMSGQSYSGIFSHANTADRTYTFPNKSGTVAMTSDISSVTYLKAYKTSDQTVTNSTTPTNDSELTVSVEASTTYSFRLKIFNTTASVTSGIKVELSGTCTVTSMKAQIYIYDDTTNSLAAFSRVTALDSPVGAGLGAGDNYVIIEGAVEINTAGTFLLQFSQNTADAVNGITVQRGSVIELFKVSA